MRYSLVMVTVLSAPALDTIVPLPLAVVTHEIWAAGRPSKDSQRATTTGLVPASTVTMEAEFWGLADGVMDGLKGEEETQSGKEKIKGCRNR